MRPYARTSCVQTATRGRTRLVFGFEGRTNTPQVNAQWRFLACISGWPPTFRGNGPSSIKVFRHPGTGYSRKSFSCCALHSVCRPSASRGIDTGIQKAPHGAFCVFRRFVGELFPDQVSVFPLIHCTSLPESLGKELSDGFALAAGLTHNPTRNSAPGASVLTVASSSPRVTPVPM
jgi:hypothetical protein